MHVWIERDGWWFVTLLAEGGAYALEVDAARHLSLRVSSSIQADAASAPRLVAEAGSWLLLAPRGAAVTVDGAEISAGARILRDGAEIRVEGSVRAFFSSEELARIEPAPAARSGELTCPRCQTAIKPGSPAVRCVGCSVWYHQDEAEGLTCFTYAPTCTFCGHETSLEGGFRWTPQDAGFGALAAEVTP